MFRTPLSRLSLPLLVFSLLLAGCSSGDDLSGGIDLDAELAEMAARLELTPAQRAEVIPTLEIFLMDKNVLFQSVIRDERLGLPAIRAELASLDGALIDDLGSELSDPQMEVLREILVGQRDDLRKELKGEDPAHSGPDMGLDDFNSTPGMNGRR